jgi:hypothetical protein
VTSNFIYLATIWVIPVLIATACRRPRSSKRFCQLLWFLPEQLLLSREQVEKKAIAFLAGFVACGA